jgi:hypothetical protein
MSRERIGKLALLGAIVAAVVLAAAAYAALPSRLADPATDEAVADGPVTIATATSVHVDSVDAFVTAFAQAAHGANVLITRSHVPGCLGPDDCLPGANTFWHMHPGPDLVVVVSGRLFLQDNRCVTTEYGAAQSFATGAEEHRVWAGSQGADFYSVYFLPRRGAALRTPAPGKSLYRPRCAW